MDKRPSQSGLAGQVRGFSVNPLISTVSPILNGAKHLEVALQAFLSQTYTNAEHIIVDGGSTDGTVDILSAYSKKYPDRIRFISEPDRGVGDAVNKGMKMARGEVMAWVDPDDFLEPDALMAVADFFKNNPEAYFVFGRSRMVDETDSKVLYTYPLKDWDLKETIEYRLYVVVGAAFWRREVIKRVGELPVEPNDLDFWIKISKEFKMHRIDNMLLNTRCRWDSINTAKGGYQKRYRRQKYREDYLICRQYGGSIFCARARKYWIGLILDKLGLLTFVQYKIMLRLRSNPTFDRIWTKLRL